MNHAEYSLGYHFEEMIDISPKDIKLFASLVGDVNPIHHDLATATHRGYEGLVACGPHVASLLAALLTKQFAPLGPMLGLGFNARFTCPYRGGPALFSWIVVNSRQSRKNNGLILRLNGSVQQGALGIIQATSTVLILCKADSAVHYG